MAKVLIFVFLIICYRRGYADAEDVCSLEPDTGPCRAAIERFAFDEKKQQCRKFTYGGCRGNRNNFETLKECQKACSKGSKNVCSLALETGMCEAYFRRYGFDTALKRCREFIYGGCNGNDNNFLTMAECRAACPARTPY